MSKTEIRIARPVIARRWTGLVATGVAVGLAVSGAVQAAAPMTGGIAPAADHLWLIAGSEGGEGGESGAAPVGSDATVELLVGLAKVEAHALSGLDLAAAGQGEAGVTQLQAAKDEILAQIAPALAARKTPLFEAELLALTDAVAAGKDAVALGDAHVALQAGLEAARAAIAPSAHDELAAVLALTRESADDFTIGVKDGQIAELGEYQDARAYLLATNETLVRLSGSADATVKAAADKSAAALAPVIAGMPDVAPTGTVTMDSATILSAAARIELASYPVK